MRIVIGILMLMLTLGVNGQDKTSTIDLTQESFKEFEILADTLNNYQVYFTGENHQYASFNTQFQLKFLKYLNHTQGVNHFVFEQGPGLGHIINEIIVNDKTTHLHYLRSMFFEPFYDLVKELRKFNEDKPLEDKIRVHGIDIERFPSFSLYALNEIVDTLDKGIKGGQVFEQIEALASSEFKEAGPAAFYSDPSENFNFQFGQVNAWHSLQSIITEAYQNEDYLKAELKDDSTTFFSIIESLKIGQEWYMSEKTGDVKSPIIRERFMADEFERVYLNDSEGKYYGQFGRCHLHKDQDAGRCYDYYMNSIANRINDIHPDLENQVLVLPIFYNKSRDFDADVINSLELSDRFINSEETYIIDLEYTQGDNPIVGFYNNLPYVIICNASKDEIEDTYDWDESLSEFHLGFGLIYNYVRGISKLNVPLSAANAGNFDQLFMGYSFYADFFEMKEQGASFMFNYYPEVSNGDRFALKGFNAIIGSSYPLGNKWLLFAPGFDMGYGKMTLLEEEVGGAPNLIQKDGKNIVAYTNDIFTLDPNVQFRLTFPLISLNAKVGYAFDVSGKYWRLDGKMKDFSKTSFTSPYVQIGASLNFKTL